ncbi:CDP-alcohol phosphatidyltransferase family protein [Candidatus Binatia bacterium]|nr:CDP-alcohol phosphatidyltransferase family protein [Candidatus Binatia bacterium]
MPSEFLRTGSSGMHIVEAFGPRSQGESGHVLDGSRRRRWLPWSLSLLRLALAPSYVIAFEVSAWLPLVLALAAAASDFVDGRLARRLGAASGTGAVLDVVGDGVFVVIALSALASLRIVTWLLPIAVVLALGGLALASLRGRAGSLEPPRRRGPADRAGHAAGIVNYGAVLAGSAAVAGVIDGAWILPASVAVAALNLAPLVLRVRRRAPG